MYGGKKYTTQKWRVELRNVLLERWLFLVFLLFFIYKLIYATYYSCWSRANQVKIARDILFLLIPGTANTVTPRAKKKYDEKILVESHQTTLIICTVDNQRRQESYRTCVYICVSNSLEKKVLWKEVDLIFIIIINLCNIKWIGL